MTRKEFVLATLASVPDAVYSPVQIQKLFFIIDKTIPELVRGPFFSFKPYNYGPFDSNVYADIELLAAENLANISDPTPWRNYSLTKDGQIAGEILFSSFPLQAQQYIRDVSTFTRKLSFKQLVTLIYNKFPEMRENSVFQG